MHNVDLVHKGLTRQSTSRKLSFAVVLAIFLSLSFGASSVGQANEIIKLMIFGDSLTAGYGLPKHEAFTTKLSLALENKGLNVQIISASVSGDTTAGGKARLGWALADKPDALLLELGANDGLRGIDPETSRANLDDILRRLKQKGTRVLMTGMMAPPNLGREYVEAFNRIFPELAKRHNVLLYPFFLEGVVARPELNQADGIHPNAEGVDEVVRRLLPKVVELLRPRKSR